MITLRPFQQEILEQLQNTSSKRIMLCAPTGAGKAVCLIEAVKYYISLNKTVLLLVDQIELVKQLAATATKLNLQFNLLQGHNKVDNKQLFTIASVQTFFRSTKSLSDYEIILHDEAHIIYKDMYKQLEAYTGILIGATATAYTEGLGNIYDKLICPITTAQLIKDGTLCKIEPYTFAKINMDRAETVAGEWTARGVYKRSADLLGDVVMNYTICAYGKRSIAFCANLIHCEAVAQAFRAKNIPVAIFTSKTSPDDRKNILKDFDDKKVWILITVSALAKGFDKPYIECILDLRPLKKSFSTYIQEIGRGLRCYPGKRSCIVLDFTGNLQRFLAQYEDLFFNGIQSLKSSPVVTKKAKVSKRKSAKAAITKQPSIDSKNIGRFIVNIKPRLRHYFKRLITSYL